MPPEIKHSFFDGQRWSDALAVKAEKSRLGDLKAVSGRDGRIYLLWAETEIFRSSPIPEERYFPPKLYLRTWDDEAWTAVEQVSDSKAEPFIFDENAMDLSVDNAGTVDAFWIDLREKNLLQGLLTMGHDEQVAKSFHRARVAGSWSDATRVQEKGGAFEVDDLTAIRDRNGGVHLFWSQTARSFRGDSGVFHSKYLEGGWTEPERVGGPQNSFHGKPGFVSNLSAAAGPDDGLYVGWVSRRYPDRSRTDETLEVLKLANGHWTKELFVTHKQIGFAWVRGIDESGGLMTQECDHPPQPYYSPIREPLEHALFFYPFRGGSFGAKELATEDALDDLFDVVIDKDGSYHLTYVREESDGQFNLMYRRASPSTE